jgi:virulence factor Mce-like protein
MIRRPRKGFVVRAAERLESHRTALGLGVVALIAAAIVISTLSINGVPFSNPYEVSAVVDPDAPLVRKGDEVRIAGQRAGQVSEVTAQGNGRLIGMELEDAEIGDGAKAIVRLRGVAGAVYIELHPGDASDPRPSGSTIPLKDTDSGIQLTDVIAGFDAATRRHLETTLNTTGAGLAGRGDNVNAALADLPPLLEQGTPLLRAFRSRPGTLTDLVSGADRTMAALGRGRGELAGMITGARETLEATAAGRDDLGDAIREAPGTESELRAATPLALPLLRELTHTARTLDPAVAKLQRALPSVNELFGRTAQVETLSRISAAAQPTLRVAGPVIERLQPTAATVGPLVRAAQPLASYVAQYPDDVFAGPHGFTTWGKFLYDDGQAKGHRAVRFTPVLTCARGRDPYPAPGAAGEDRKPCF